MKSLAQLYAVQHQLHPDEVERDIFSRCLYPHARVLCPLLNLMAPMHFSADIDMVSDVMQLTDPGEFRFDVRAHRHHPTAGGFWRRWCFLRLSTHKLHLLVWATFHPVHRVTNPAANPSSPAASSTG